MGRWGKKGEKGVEVDFATEVKSGSVVTGKLRGFQV